MSEKLNKVRETLAKISSNVNIDEETKIKATKIFIIICLNKSFQCLEKHLEDQKKAEESKVAKRVYKFFKNYGPYIILGIIITSNSGKAYAIDDKEITAIMYRAAKRAARSLGNLAKVGYAKRLFRSSDMVPHPAAISDHIESIWPSMTLPELIDSNPTFSWLPIFYSTIFSTTTVWAIQALIEYYYPEQ